MHSGSSGHGAGAVGHGESLTDRLENCGRFLPHDAVEIARQIASALEAAHAAGVLHRNLEPDSIFVVDDTSMPGGLRIEVLDSGRAGDTPPRYRSPEQCRSSATIDHGSEIYALGCILFELITGSPPFDGDLQSVVEAHLVGNIPRASTFTGCSPHLDELIMRLMAKDPARRPPSMTAVRRALDQLPLGRLGSVPRTPLPAPPVPSSSRGRVGQQAIARVAPVRVPAHVASLAPRSPVPPPLPPHLTPPSSARLPRVATSVRPSAIAMPSELPAAAPARDSGSRLVRGSESPPSHRAPLPPYFPPPPTVATSPHAPAPDGGSPLAPTHPSRSASIHPPPAFAPMHLPPTAFAPMNVLPPSTPTRPPPTMSSAMPTAMAIPVGLPSPDVSTHVDGADDLDPPMNKLPVIILAIACALSGALAAHLLF